MGKKPFRLVCLGIQALISLVLGTLTVRAMLVLMKAEGATSSLPMEQLIITLLHLIMAFVGACLIMHYYRNTVGPEAQLLPLLFLLLALSDTRILPTYMTLTHDIFFDIKWVSVVFQICFLSISLLYIECGLFQTEINSRKLVQFVLIGFACSICLGLLVPISYNSKGFQLFVSITNYKLRISIYVLGVLGIISSFAILFQENATRSTMLRAFAFSLLMVSHTMNVIRPINIVSLISTILFGAGLSILVFVTKANRIWG
ncbi:MAG: hypothetical protein WCR02_10605 [Sphaerochaetaceae bacterium]